MVAAMAGLLVDLPAQMVIEELIFALPVGSARVPRIDYRVCKAFAAPPSP